MASLRVINSNRFRLPGNPHFLHIATIGKSLREFIVMLCIRGEKKGNLYIEEVVLNSVDWKNDITANLKFIDDDELAEELFRFVEDKKIVDMKVIADELIDSGKESWILKPKNGLLKY